MKKILIIAGGLQIGGAERVAANISKYAPKNQFEFHYLVFEGIENVYGVEIEAAGGTVFTVPSPANGYMAYIRALRRLMKEHRYAAVHSHTMFNSGLNLLVAKLSGVPCRIAHSHTTKTETSVSVLQKVYEYVMRMLIRMTATNLFSCGVEAGYWMFGKAAFDRKGIVISNGIDTDAFSWSAEMCQQIRAHYGLEDAFVIGHSGTLLPLKNQSFLIRLMPKILIQRPNAKLLLVGSGTQEYTEELKQLAQTCGVAESVFFCGGVNNVFAYLSAFDVFVFPSLREGTPLALIEAQTNGLPCIISDRIPKDARLTDLITVLPLENEEAWVSGICGAKRNQRDYAEVIASKGYSANRAYQPIYDAYVR